MGFQIRVRPGRRWSGPALYLLFMAVTAEVGLQVLGQLSPAFDMALSNRFGQPPFVEDPRLGLHPNPRYGDHDAWGFRNAGRPDGAEVVALGDSQTYGLSAPREAAWPQRLSQRLGLRVYNMACGSWGPGHYPLLLPRALALRPRLVLASLYTGNDLWDLLEMAYLRRTVPQLEPFARPDAAFVHRLEAARADLIESSREAARWLDAEPAAATVRSSGPSTAWSPTALLRDRSRLWGLARLVRSNLRQPSRQRPPGFDEGRWANLRDGARARTEVAVCGEGATRALLDAGYREQAFAEDLWPEGLRLAVEALTATRDRLAASNVPMVVVLIPTKELAFAPLCSVAELGKGAYARLLDAEQRARALAVANLTARGIPVVDTLPALQGGLRRGQAAYPWTIDSHPNAVGYGIIADVIAQDLQGRGLVDTPKAADRD